MTSKRGSDIKAAIAALRVSQPMRLSKEGPQLRSPAAPMDEAPHHEAPPLAPSPFEPAPSEVTRNEVAPCEAPQPPTRPEAPRNEVPHIEGSEPETPRKKKPRSEASRPELGDLELPRFEETQGEGRSSGGFFRLSVDVFEEPSLRQLTGDGFRLFLWLSTRAWRFPDSKGIVRASVSYMENGTGMGHATVSRALKSLKDRGLISLLETDFKRGNLWKISTTALTGGTPPPRRRRLDPEAAQTELPRIDSPAASKGVPVDLDSSDPVTQIEREFKNYKNLKNLSQEARRFLLPRIMAASAPSKRRSEASRLDSLLGVYPAEQLCAALEFLDNNGTLSGEKCHSPFSYLAMAGDEVIKRILPSDPAITIPSRVDKEEEERIRESSLQRFAAELSPAAQVKVVEAFTQTEYPHGFLPPPRVVRALAAMAWCREHAKAPLQHAG